MIIINSKYSGICPGLLNICAADIFDQIITSVQFCALYHI